MSATIRNFGRRLRLGVIGGGPGSFIGEVHRTAARIDDHFEVVASVLSSNAEKSRAEGAKLGIAADRAYGDAAAMFAGEAAREDGIDVVAIMTPNDSHCPLSRAAIDAGLDVICDKPLSTHVEEAEDLAAHIKASGLIFCQTFNYTGFPMVRQARAMIRDGDLGEVRLVQVEYVQGHNAALTEAEQSDPPGDWHFVPERVGPSLILSDIGSHAHHMAGFVANQRVRSVMADVGTLVPGRNAHDYANALLTMENGAPGVMDVTQAGAGAVHGLSFRIFCAEGGLSWQQETPNQLHVSRRGAPALTLERDGPGLKPEAARATRTGFGHPEGYQEAFAQLYAEAAEAIVARRQGQPVEAAMRDLPTVEDGVATVRFIRAALESSDSRRWVDCL